MNHLYSKTMQKYIWTQSCETNENILITNGIKYPVEHGEAKTTCALGYQKDVRLLRSHRRSRDCWGLDCWTRPFWIEYTISTAIISLYRECNIYNLEVSKPSPAHVIVQQTFGHGRTVNRWLSNSSAEQLRCSLWRKPEECDLSWGPCSQ